MLLSFDGNLRGYSIVGILFSGLGGAASGFILVNGTVTKVWLEYMILVTLAGLAYGGIAGALIGLLLLDYFVEITILFTFVAQLFFSRYFYGNLKINLEKLIKESGVEEN